MKKVLSLVLVLTLVLGSFSFAFAATPTDVVGTEYEDAVERLGQLGVLTGYDDGTFKPENTITRAEFAAVVVRAKGLEAAAQASKGATAFSDVAAGSWAAGYVNVASKMGFVKGMGDGTFAPNAPVTYEQAVTMVMRALGYEPAAEAKGGYPYGYLIVANEIGLLEKVNGTTGAPALRGTVAKIVDNALEIPLMVQVSYGDRIEYVVSGTREGVAEKTLLSELGYTKYTGRVVEVNSDKEFIKIEDSNGNVKALYVDEDFDFQNAYGLRVRVWYDVYANVQLYTVLDTPIFDAVEPYKGGLYLYGEDDVYDLSTNTKGNVIATLILDGKKVDVDDFYADYAKVVLDTYGDVIWAEGFTLEGNIVVEKVDGNVVESFGYEELSLKGYTIVDRDGNTISVQDLEKNDIVFYNSKVKFAVVYNESVTGKIEKVYQNPDSFVLDGEKYDVDYAKYLDGDVLGDLNYNIVNSIKSQDKEVTIYFDFYGNLVLLQGTRAAATTPNIVVVIDSVKYPNRAADYYTLDVLNAEGKIVKYDLTAKNVADILGTTLQSDGTLSSTDEADWFNLVKDVTDKVVQLNINASGKIVGITTFSTEPIVNSSSTWLQTTDTYVNNVAKLQDSAVVFRVDGATDPEDYSVTTWGKAEEEFTRVEDGIAYYNSSNKVVAIYAVQTNAKAATTVYTGLVTDVRVLRGGLKADVTMEIKGEEKVITTPVNITGYNLLVPDTIVKVTVVNKTGEMAQVDTAPVVPGAKVTKVTPGSKSIVTDKGTFYYDEAVIYNSTFTQQLRIADVKVNDIIDVYVRAAGSPYALYVVKGTTPTTTPTTIELTTFSTAAATVTNAVYDATTPANNDYVLKVTNVDTNAVVYATGTVDSTGTINFTFSTPLAAKAVYKVELFVKSPVSANLKATWADQFLAN